MQNENDDTGELVGQESKWALPEILELLEREIEGVIDQYTSCLALKKFDVDYSWSNQQVEHGIKQTECYIDLKDLSVRLVFTRRLYESRHSLRSDYLLSGVRDLS